MSLVWGPSMKAPPKRKGNPVFDALTNFVTRTLNESPSEKEGKSSSPRMIMRGVRKPLNESPSEKEGKLSVTVWAVVLRSPLNESPSEKEGKFLMPALPTALGGPQ